MNYKEKLKAFEEGTLPENECAEIEKDLEKFEALLSFFEDSRTPAALSDENNISADEINRIFAKKLNGKIIRTVLTVLFFAILFTLSLVANRLVQNVGGTSLTEYVFQAVLSLVFIPTVVILLYRAFAKKERGSAIILLCWIIVPTVVSFIVSAIIGDVFAAFLPAYYGFSRLPYALFALINDNLASTIASVCGIGGMAGTVILSVIALILSGKKISFKTLSKKAGAIILASSLLLGTVAIALSTSMAITRGEFPDAAVCSDYIAGNVKSVYPEVFDSSLLQKSPDEIGEILEKNGFTEDLQGDISRYVLVSDNILTAEIICNGSETEAVNFFTAYSCRNPLISVNAIDELFESFNGMDEKSVIGELMSDNLIPSFVSFYSEGGKTVADYQLHLNIPATDFNLARLENIKLHFEDGNYISADYE